MCASWPLGSWLLGYIYALLSLGPFIFGMPTILSPILGPSMDPGVILGGITAPYRAHRFGNGHIPSYVPFLEAFFSSLSLYTGGHPHGGGSGYVNVGSTLYFPFLCPIVHRIVSFGCICHDHSSLFPIVWIIY